MRTFLHDRLCFIHIEINNWVKTLELNDIFMILGQNNRGVYMRISEVKTNFRTAITLPEKSWARFRDILSDYCDKIKQPAGGSGSQGAGLGGQDQPHPLVSTVLC